MSQDDAWSRRCMYDGAHTSEDGRPTSVIVEIAAQIIQAEQWTAHHVTQRQPVGDESRVR